MVSAEILQGPSTNLLSILVLCIKIFVIFFASFIIFYLSISINQVYGKDLHMRYRYIPVVKNVLALTEFETSRLQTHIWWYTHTSVNPDPGSLISSSGLCFHLHLCVYTILPFSRGNIWLTLDTSAMKEEREKYVIFTLTWDLYLLEGVIGPKKAFGGKYYNLIWHKTM